jgi:hypothetical protein
LRTSILFLISAYGRRFRVCPRGVLELVGLDADGERIVINSRW